MTKEEGERHRMMMMLTSDKEAEVESLSRTSLDVLRNPFEALTVAHSPHDAAHEHLDRTHVRAFQVHLPLPRRVVGQSERVAELLLRCRLRHVDLVAQNQKGYVAERLVREQTVELALRLGEAVLVHRVDEEDDSVNLRVIILPHAPRNLVPAEIEGLEADLTNAQLLARRVLRRLMLCESLIL